jgi:hypothetical protein
MYDIFCSLTLISAAYILILLVFLDGRNESNVTDMSGKEM